MLAGDGRILRHASSGPEALMQLLREDFAVILLDVNMPGMDGYSLTATPWRSTSTGTSWPGTTCDDIRNIFALTSALERYDMVIVNAESGPDALALLQAVPDVDVVLMDIVMPEMDGFDIQRLVSRLRVWCPRR